MLAEVWKLSQGLERSGISPALRHPRVKEPGLTTGPILRVLLNPTGQVASLEPMPREQAVGLWTTMEGQMNSFPVVRIDIASGKWAGKDLRAISKLGEKKVPQLLAEFAGPLGVAPVRTLCERFIVAASDVTRLATEVQAAAQRGIDAGTLAAADVAPLLEGADATQRPKATKLQLAFDLAGTSIYTSATRDHVVRALLTADARVDSVDPKAPVLGCAFTEERHARISESFPKVRLPVINKDVPLFSMAKEAACNTRYRLSGSDLVPVAQSVRLRLQDALAWIVDGTRQRSTWQAVPNPSKETSDLLIAFLEDRPDLPVPLAALFGETHVEAQFVADSKAVCEALVGVVRAEPSSRVSVFVVRGVSRGQAQAVLSSNWEAKLVLAAARRWQEAGANRPAIRLLPGSDAERSLTARAPYPAQLARLTREQWLRDGRLIHSAQGSSLGEIFQVFLWQDPQPELAARRLLDRLVLNHQLLVEASAEPAFRVPKAAEAIEQAINAIGVLLSLLNRPMEDYMHAAPFLIGRLLALADSLHREYCRDVRDNSVPPQLIGNALLGVARDSPVAAVDRLGERLAVYQAWANRFEGDRVALVSWLLGELGAVARDISLVQLPHTTTETDRAELLLGYLFRAPANTVETASAKGS